MPTFALPATLDAASVPGLQTTLLRDVAQSQGDVVLDASTVQRFDSAGLALLLACRRAAQARGQALQVQAWPPGLQALARVYGVLGLLDPQSQACAEDVLDA